MARPPADLHAELLSLLAESQTTGDPNARLALLQAALETCLHRDSSLLLEGLSHLCSPALQLDDSQDVRHFVLKLSEEIFRLQPVPLPALLAPCEALALMLENASQPIQVVRWAITAASKSWRKFLTKLAHLRALDTCQNLTALLCRVKARIVELLATSRDRAVRLNAVKFVETVALTLLPSDTKTQQFASLADDLRNHPTWANDVEEQGQALVSLLLRLVAPSEQVDVPLRLAACNSLTTLAKYRPKLLPQVLSCFERAAESAPPALSQTLKELLKMLLKGLCSAPEAFENLDKPVFNQLSTLLVTLHAGDYVNKTVQPVQKKRDEKRAQEADLQRRLLTYPDQRNLFPVEGLHKLPIDMLAQLLVVNAQHVPSRPPPGHMAARPELPTLQGSLPIKLERVVNLVRAVETGRGLNLPRALVDVTPRNLSPQEALLQRESAFGRVAHAVGESVTASARAGGAGWEPRSQEMTQVIAARLACDFGFTDTGDGDLRPRLLQDVLLGKGEDLTAVTTALMLEFAADLKRNDGRYVEFVLQLVRAALADPARNAKRLGRLLCEAPSVPRVALAELLGLMQSDVAKDVVFALAVFKDLALAVPSARPVCVSAVLLATCTRNDDSGRSAVRLAVNILFAKLDPAWQKRIRDFAKSVSATLVGVGRPFGDCLDLRECRETVSDVRPLAPREPANAGDEATMRCQLLLALCAHEGALVGDLLRLYAGIADSPRDEHKAVILMRLEPITDKLWQSLATNMPLQKALSLLQNFPPGALELVLQACRVFAKKDTDVACTPVTLLRQQGEHVPCWERDARFVVPVIGSLGRDEAMKALARIFAELGHEDLMLAVANVVNGTVGRTIEAVELVLTLVNLEAETLELQKKLSVFYKDLIEHKGLISERVLRRVFEEVCEQTVLPVGLMLFVLLAHKAKQVVNADVLELLHKLAARSVWTNEHLWVGYCKCVYALRPESFALALRLPDDQIADLITRHPDLKRPLANFAKVEPEFMVREDDDQGEGENEEEVEDVEDDEARTRRGLSARIRALLEM